jgi:hypothetical protein
MFPRKLNLKSNLLQVSLFVVIFYTITTFGQETNTTESSKDVMTSVFNDVWRPFMESYRELDIEKFKSLQANELTKVAIDRNTIQTKSAYFAEIEGFFNQFKQLKRQLDIKFSILSSASGDGKIYQTGYYGMGARQSDSESFQTMGYGYFTVVLIKEDGYWKISLDADKRSAINEDEFRKSDVIYELD